ncbi:serine O-acetyltransferase [Helicobacter sp. 12S02232-10]|uniref:serine O-acetyltransferase n=1 Tax=Helicobacter sp. 12S02232-10 TaxID=1476197 RepID=UPI000BA6B7B5|nr:serine O-acetyltransferase [Helicobacter sp. 12S02232-10]PAF49570.1 serine O-acetyltransferase [Helicobacter sp. 12S02232-10]
METKQIGFFSLIKEDFSVPFQKDPAINSKIELFFNYPGVVAIVHYRIAHKLHLLGFKVIARILMGFTQFLTNIDIHPACKIGRRVFIDHGIGVVIGETAEIGDNVTIYQGVSLGGVSLEKIKRHPTLKKGVVVGAGAKILGNITIGENAKIGANSVVVKNVPPDATAVGIPARVIDKEKSKEENIPIQKLPDIDKELFRYLIKKISLIEQSIQANPKTTEEETELQHLYENYIRCIKN